MNRSLLVLAALLLAAPAFAQEWAGDDDLSWQADEEAPPPPAEDRGPAFDDFRNDTELSAAGEWIDTPEYGVVWHPTRIDPEWRPYLYGHWEWTTLGWAWVSDEPFGWAVYHYGRWAHAGGWGWMWIPGRVWAPAWVAWRWGGGHAGWCPLGPRGRVFQSPGAWVFVEHRHFLEAVRPHAVPIAEVRVLYSNATALPLRRGPHAGPAAVTVERATGRGLRPMPIADAPSPRAASSSGARVFVYRPHTAPVTSPQAAPAPGPRARGASEEQQKPEHPIYFGGVPSRGIVEKNQPHAEERGKPKAAPPAKGALKEKEKEEDKPRAR